MAERGRFVPWLPVFMGTGVLGYFALRVEPPLWLGASVAVPLLCAVLLLRQHYVLRAAVIALAATDIGFTSGQFATARAPLPVVLPTHATIIAGTVRSVEAAGRAARDTGGDPA